MDTVVARTVATHLQRDQRNCYSLSAGTGGYRPFGGKTSLKTVTVTTLSLKLILLRLGCGNHWGDSGFGLRKEISKCQIHENCRVILLDTDKEYDIFGKSRTLPCVARFIYPTVGFDGRLYQCSQSAAPNFKEMELGDLKTSNFWDLYYSYDVSNFNNFFNKMGKKMEKLGCRCDRKEHIVNMKINKSGLFA